MRVGIIGLNHESNTYCPQPTTFADFERDVLATGREVEKLFAGAHHEIGGFFQGLIEGGVEAVPLFYARAVPCGTITADTIERLLALMLRQVGAAGRLDGLLVAPHGAAVSEREPDMDGYWLTKLRDAVGPDLPIIITLDLHANLSPRMVRAVNATVAYRRNPHLDQRQRGVEASRLMVRTLRGEIRPTQAASFPRLAINIERQYTDDPPCKPMYDFADAMLRRRGVLANSILLGFPYSDVPEMGSSFIVVTDNDPKLAQKLADEMSAYVIAHRDDFVGRLISVDEAVTRAAGVSAAGRPVCLLDMGDNVGGGSPGDGVVIAHVIHRRGGLRAFTLLRDATSQAAARHAGVGKRIRLKLGGTSMPCYGPPLEDHVTVRSLHDGIITEDQVRHGGFTRFDMGPSAVVETDRGITALLTTHRTYPSSLNQLYQCGLDPKSFDVLIAKGVHAPVGAYGLVCPTLIRVNTPGVTSADMTGFVYNHRSKPLFPFEPIPV